jgi:hypothetical protein
MTNKEKRQHIMFIQYRFNYVMRMIPKDYEITLLESSTHIDSEGCKIIDNVLFRIGELHYRMDASMSVQILDKESGLTRVLIREEGVKIYG